MTVTSDLRHSVTTRVCRHISGVAVASTLAALGRHSVLDDLNSRGSTSVAHASEISGGRPGYVGVALRLLADRGWLRGEIADMDREVVLTARGRTALSRWPEFARDADRLPDPPLPPLSGAVDALLSRSARTPHAWTDPLDDHLDGLVAAPVMTRLALLGENALDEGEWKALEAFGWADSRCPTEAGRTAMAAAIQYVYPMMYSRMVRDVPTLLFGDEDEIHRVIDPGDTARVDRGLDIQFSGLVSRQTCLPSLLRVTLPIFEGRLDGQPDAIVDTGCGDGTLLSALWHAVRTRTIRGAHLGRRPLTCFGVEPSPVARARASRRLAQYAVPGEVFDGDIGRPQRIAHELSRRDVDPTRVLHISKSVLHNRRFVPPETPPPPTPPVGAFATPDGRFVSPAAAAASLVDLLRAWRPHLGPHGVIVIESHTVPSAVAAAEPVGMHTVFDATHGYSNQLPVDAATFAWAAEAAGLRRVRHHDILATTTGEPFLTVDHLVDRHSDA